MEIWFQKGEYPVRQVIFVNIDSVMGSLFTSTMFKPKYGRIDILHDIRKVKGKASSDLEMLMATTLPVISACWTAARAKKVLNAYTDKRGWARDSVRVYELCTRK